MRTDTIWRDNTVLENIELGETVSLNAADTTY